MTGRSPRASVQLHARMRVGETNPRVPGRQRNRPLPARHPQSHARRQRSVTSIVWLLVRGEAVRGNLDGAEALVPIRRAKRLLGYPPLLQPRHQRRLCTLDLPRLGSASVDWGALPAGG